MSYFSNIIYFSKIRIKCQMRLVTHRDIWVAGAASSGTLKSLEQVSWEPSCMLACASLICGFPVLVSEASRLVCPQLVKQLVRNQNNVGEDLPVHLHRTRRFMEIWFLPATKVYSPASLLNVSAMVRRCSRLMVAYVNLVSAWNCSSTPFFIQ